MEANSMLNHPEIKKLLEALNLRPEEVKEYKDLIHKKIETLSGRARVIADAHHACFIATYSTRHERGEALKHLLFDGKSSMEEVLADGLADFFYALLPEEMAKKHCNLVLRQQEYIYDASSYRRSFRSANPAAYFSAVHSIMRSVYFNWYGFDLLDYLAMSSDEVKEKKIIKPDSFMVSQLLALEIDNGSQRAIDAAKETITSENNAGIIDHTFARAMAKCRNEELHSLMKGLLLAAKLQEGLRQVILETADDGTMAYFILMIQTILENNLLRFSSVLRAVMVWTGVGSSYEDRRVVEKLLTLGYAYLTDGQARRAACGSPDVMEMYAAMWAESFYSLEKLCTYIEAYAAGEKYQKLVAFYFLAQTRQPEYATLLASRHLREADMDVLAWILLNFGVSSGWSRDKSTFLSNCRSNAILSDEKGRARQFECLTAILKKIPKEGHVVSKKPFDWCQLTLERDAVFQKLLVIGGYEPDSEKISRMIDFIDYAASDSKIKLINYLLEAESREKDRRFLFDCLSDKSMPVRIAAAKALKELQMKEEELLRIEQLLALKTGEIRQIALDIIKNRTRGQVCASVDRLIRDKAENKRLGALDLLVYLLSREEIGREQADAYISCMPKITERERVLVEELQRQETQQYTLANGFGLYQVEFRPAFPPLAPEPEYTLSRFRAVSAEQCKQTIASLIAVIEQHKDDTFMQKVWDGSEREVILGNLKRLIKPAALDTSGEGPQFDKLVLAEVWKRWVQSNGISLMTLTKINFAKKLLGFSYRYTPDYEAWTGKLLAEYFPPAEIQEIGDFLKGRAYNPLACDIINQLIPTFPEEEIFKLNYGILVDFIGKTKEEDWKKPAQKVSRRYSSGKEADEVLLKDLKEVQYFLGNLDFVVSEGEIFAKRIALCYEMGRLSGYQFIGLDEVEVAMAVSRNVLPVNELYRAFFRQEPTRKMMNYTGNMSKLVQENCKKYPVLAEVAQTVVSRVIEIEIKRGDTSTEVSHMAKAIRRHEGAENFANILLALGNETLTRGYQYGSSYTKRDVLSSLLKACVPAPGDDAKKLSKALGGRIPDKRLLEAAMYAPAWIAIIEAHLGWKGLKSGAWYFHAHTSSGFSAEAETEIARFSPISKREFQDGAFDIKWFKSAHKALGAKRFDILYQCAKYISDGASHRRAQLFADAVLGRLPLKSTQAQIAEKRNKDLLLSYSLIPFGRNKLKDALNRYEFIQKFLKESKSFGAQRKVSEGKACEIALGNLARNLGYDDVMRFSWKMEVLKLDQLTGYFKPYTIEDCTVYIDEATADIVVKKGDKALKSVPAKLKKHPYIEALKTTKAALAEQSKRAKASFEKAMETQDAFPFEEILDLMKHPVIRPVITKLVFLAEGELGFLTEQGMQVLDGEIAALDLKTPLTVAHSYHMYQSGHWSEFQRYAFENGLVQPFKQIFRELYLINEDEKQEKTISRRYAGNQIQPKKTVALLKGRNWTVDYDQGLQKVHYRENVIASIYALADWFSPGDVEAPTLETVEFRDRNTYKPVPFEDLPPVLFSETMRDVDLVVSIAHVGGVDPLTSHSTMQMRSMMIREITALLKLENVTVEGSYAKITGKKGEYSVHLGSGIAHMSGKGALNILPVHSQHRGKLFLPFLDEDPKTAEILSKILLLAEDDKIKDATILSQLL